jgi:hypothetical protein
MEFVTDIQYSDIGQNAKGNYNITDIQRVTNNAFEIKPLIANTIDEITTYREQKGVASGMPYNIPLNADFELFSMPDYDYNSIPTAEELANYLENVEKIANAVELSHNLPKTMENLNIDGANAIEKTLENGYNKINNVKTELLSKIDRTIWEYCGDYYGGGM